MESCGHGEQGAGAEGCEPEPAAEVEGRQGGKNSRIFDVRPCRGGVQQFSQNLNFLAHKRESALLDTDQLWQAAGV
jgi:hypothetical protein